MVQPVSGEYAVDLVIYLLGICLDMLQTPLFTYKGASVSLWHFLTVFMMFSIAVDLYVIIMGGSPDDYDPEEVYDFETERNDYWD